MAHFAKISLSLKVISVLTLDDKNMLNVDGVEDESVGQQYLEKHNNWPTAMWIQTSYTTALGKHKSGDDSKALRGTYAGIGYTWDENNNIFYPKKPFASWVLDIPTASWKSPKGDAPDLGAESETHYYDWNESGQSWDKIAKAT